MADVTGSPNPDIPSPMKASVFSGTPIHVNNMMNSLNGGEVSMKSKEQTSSHHHSSSNPLKSSSSSESKPREGSASHNSLSLKTSSHHSSSSIKLSHGSSSSSSKDSKPRDQSSSLSKVRSDSSGSGLGGSSSREESRQKENGTKSSDSSSRQRDGSAVKSAPRLTESSFLTDNITAKPHHHQASDRHRTHSAPKTDDKERQQTGERKSTSSGSTDLKQQVKGEHGTPVKVKVEQGSPVKTKAEGSPSKDVPKKMNTSASDDDDDIPLFSRIGKEEKPVISRGDNKNDDEDDDDDAPLFDRAIKKQSSSESKVRQKRAREGDSSGEDSDVPLANRVTKVMKRESKEDIKKRRHSTGSSSLKRKHKHDDDDDEDSDNDKKKKKSKKSDDKHKGSASGGSHKKKKEEEQANNAQCWKWWEEDEQDMSIKWNSLEHKGPLFAPAYEPLPPDVKFYYDGKCVQLSEGAEEVAGFYGKMLEHDYTTRDLFNNNFMKDWRKVMTSQERELIKDIKKCNFRELCEYFKMKSDERKNLSKDEKQALKKEWEDIDKVYGFCIIDGHKQKIGNFRIEPPGLFRGRGDHPKQGALKRRIVPTDVIINCSKGSKIPTPPAGTKWKEVRHDNTVTWLASWTENVQGATKYVMLNASSKLKGKKDMNKYEIARKLHKCIDKIRSQYQADLKAKEMGVRQRAVALYFIDKLALRAGNEKDEDTADTVGCCSLRVEHIKLHDMYDGKENVVVFDFPGKDSIRYYNEVSVEARVFKSLKHFIGDKQPSDDLFDRLNTGLLNKHLQSLMDGLSAKVFRTYNASRTLQEQLDQLTDPKDPVAAKMLSYNRANRAVAILCNHQRAAPKNFDKQMENLQTKIDAKKDLVRAAKKDLKDAKSDYKASKSAAAKILIDKRQKAYERLEDQLHKLKLQATDKDENKEIALGTSKLNYLDPRISVAWCKKFDVPIEKVYNKTQREKFAWAIDMTDEDYHFC